MRIITKIITIMVVCFFLVTIGVSYYVYNSTSELDQLDLGFTLDFVVDADARTITVNDIKNIDFNWDDISLVNGDALLPTGSIEVDDVIKNCYGTVALSLPGDFVIGGWEFSERPDNYYEDIRFLGSWGSEGQDLNFYEDGTYFNDWDSDANESVMLLQNGKYKAETILIVDDENLGETYECDVVFSAHDTALDIYCNSKRVYYQYNRTFSDELFLKIINASNKLDNCSSIFISNYTNETHQDVLTEGLNVTVEFTYELTTQEINNLTDIGIVFNTDLDGNITHTNSNYSIKINSLQDLYYLVSRIDVIQIIANDDKFLEFGCSNLL